MKDNDFCSKWAKKGPEGPFNAQGAVPVAPQGGVPCAPEALFHAQGAVPAVQSDRERVEALVAAVEAAQRDITPTYNDWFSAGVALASSLREEGRTYFHRLSRFYAGYSYQECDKKYNDCLRDPNPAYTLGTLFHLAKQAGIQVAQAPKVGAATPQAAAAQAAQAVAAAPQVTAAPFAAGYPPAQAAPAAPAAQAAIALAAPEAGKKSKKPNKIATIIGFFKRKFHDGADLRRDVLSGKIQYLQRDESGNLQEEVWMDVTDNVLCSFTCRINEETGLNISSNEVHTVLKSDLVKSVNPLQDWLHKLPKYEPQEGCQSYIEALANQVHVKPTDDLGTDQKRWVKCFVMWFVAMVAGWLDSRHPNHQALVLVSEKQGIYKTTWLEHLMPPVLRQYLCKQASVREFTKDDRMRITEYGLINLDEIDSMNSRELNVLKSVITTNKVNERAPYARTKDDRPRFASFCGSGNNKRFLSDDTGNRRWLPFEVDSIDSPWEHEEPYEMIYAEAKYLAESGTFKYYFDQDEIQEMAAYTDNFRAQTPEEELLNIYYQPAKKGDEGAIFVTAAEIHRTLIDAGRITRPMPINKFGGMLKREGYTKYSLARGKKGYLVIEHKYQDINDKHKEEAQEVLSTMPTPPQENEALEDANLAINDADSKLPDNCLPF